MSIDWNILGKPGEDNAVHLTVNTGQSVHSLLIDCGERVLDSLKIGQIQSIEQLCFSHLHMDHVAGFDSFFRHNYNRPDVPISVWGPKETCEKLHHRFRSFVWNLHHDQPGEWIVREVTEAKNESELLLTSSRYFTSEAYETAHPRPSRVIEDGVVIRSSAYEMKVLPLPHHSISSLAYQVSETPKTNVDPGALRESGLTPGPWLQSLLDETIGADEILPIDDRNVSVGEWRERLLVETSGDSIACLTDFRVEPETEEWSRLVSWLADTDILICECQYRMEDAALARKNGHMTTDLVGQLAKEAGVKQLVLQHLSRRYQRSEWLEMRDEVRSVFTEVGFPEAWGLSH
jgi:ribonuclease Z